MLINTSDSPLVYLDAQTANTPDVVMYPDSGKFVVIAGNMIMKPYKIDSSVNYLLDE